MSGRLLLSSMVLFVLLSFCFVVSVDASALMWDQTYGGPERDEATSLVVTSDGGYVIAGSTTSFGAEATDFWLVKTDASGDIEWNQTYGYEGAAHDFARSVVKAFDGGYALAGYAGSPGSEIEDFWIVKTDENGTLEWSKAYGGSDWDSAYSLVATSDGGYMMAGETMSASSFLSDCWLIKTDENGIVPEYSSWLLPSILLVATLVIVICKKGSSIHVQRFEKASL